MSKARKASGPGERTDPETMAKVCYRTIPLICIPLS